MTTTGAGPLLREWRGRRRRSQMDLALEVGVSTKHLSFVETGRSRPSPELLLTLARHLEVPLRERNSLLLAAGYAPRYHETAIDDPASQHVRASLERLLQTHDPYPGVVLNRRWDIVLANDAAMRMVAAVPTDAEEQPVRAHCRGDATEGMRLRKVDVQDASMARCDVVDVEAAIGEDVEVSAGREVGRSGGVRVAATCGCERGHEHGECHRHATTP